MSISSQHEHAITNPVAGLGVGYLRGYWVATAHHRAECLTGNQSKYGGHPGASLDQGCTSITSRHHCKNVTKWTVLM